MRREWEENYLKLRASLSSFPRPFRDALIRRRNNLGHRGPAFCMTVTERLRNIRQRLHSPLTTDSNDALDGKTGHRVKVRAGAEWRKVPAVRAPQRNGRLERRTQQVARALRSLYDGADERR